MYEKNTIAIEPNRFRHAFKRRGLALNEASVAMGLNCNWITNVCNERRQKISPHHALLMERLWNITRDEYEVKPEAESVTQTAPTETPAVNLDELYKTVYSAVYNATKQAYKDI